MSLVRFYGEGFPYLRLADQNRIEWRNRAHFYGVAAALIRNILVDYARTHRAAKRGGGDWRLSLDEAGQFFLGRRHGA